jgi:ribosomal protein L24E
MKVYIDSDYKCHISNDGTMRAVEFDENKLFVFFRNKCPEFIEAYRYVPADETWTREDGEVFNGEMFSPWNLTEEVLEAQHHYEVAQLAKLTEEAKTAVSLSEMDEAYREGVNSV